MSKHEPRRNTLHDPCACLTNQGSVIPALTG